MVLNSSYEPIKIVNWQKALLLWFTNKVEVVEYHSSIFVNSAYSSFQVPSVLRLKKYIHSKFTHSVKFSRENVYLRDLYTCQYCHSKLPFRQLTLDHVVPISQGGGNHWLNVVAACSPCNNKKGGRTPDQANMPLIRRPFIPERLPARSIVSSEDWLPEYWAPYFPSHNKTSHTGS
ncbi:MAG: HNH endonuclease [Bdellovibrionales bacterium]|nr:HNH endonuclease [Bdellovibrionales bacterium]